MEYFFSQHLDKSSEKSGETERLKRLMSENSSLKQKTFELQTQLQGLLQKLEKRQREGETILELVLTSFQSLYPPTSRELGNKDTEDIGRML